MSTYWHLENQVDTRVIFKVYNMMHSMLQGDGFSVRTWPGEYSSKNNNLSSSEKKLLKFAQDNFKEGHFVVSIDPVGLSSDKIRMGMAILPDKGLITFSLVEELATADNVEMYKAMTAIIEDKIYRRLLDSKLLIAKNGQRKFLKFPYQHLLIFVNEKFPVRLTPEVSNKYKEFSTLLFFLPFDIQVAPKKLKDLFILKNIKRDYEPNFSGISEEESQAIFQKLAPEYSIVTNICENCVIKESSYVPAKIELEITGKESAYKTFFLDDDQVKIVNDIGKGHRVLLANPGAGKSVLLLAKAFKYGSLYKGNKDEEKGNILLTCYNSNLCESYLFKKNCSNAGNYNNLFILTFHKLVRKLLEGCGIFCKSNIPDDAEIERCLELAESGKIKTKFQAIFIDEVQIFEPKFIKLCYLLLENKENSLFLLAGDLNQAVRKKARKGDVPWKQLEGVKLDFTGRVRYIEKNYRNTKQIGEYLNNMLRYMNKKMQSIGVSLSNEFDYNLFKYKRENSVAIHVESNISRVEITKRVVNSIKEIREKFGVSYSEIAVIFPYKRYAIKRYYFLYWIKKQLDEEGIPYTVITPEETTIKPQFSNWNGVVLSTIDSSLGLDFTAVILAGLYPYNFICYGDKLHQITTWDRLRKEPEEAAEQVQIQMRHIYTAASRARDILYVLSDLDNNALLSDLIGGNYEQ